LRRKLIAGNWKMNLGLKESGVLAKQILEKVKPNILMNADILICPPFISLSLVSGIIKDSGIKLGAQNLHFENDGAYTGEISATMLRSAGCEYVITGHSERRKYFNETNSVVNKKALQALNHDLKVIICVGETLQEREDEIFESIITEQVTMALKDIPSERMNDVVIAYEPVWAIGTGLNASPKQVIEIHALIRNTAEGILNKDIAENMIILYGGSVNKDNAKEILSAAGVDGALIGGASLKPDDFVFIAEQAAAVK